MILIRCSSSLASQVINLTSFWDKDQYMMSDLGVSNRSAHLVHDTTLPEWIGNATTATWEDVKAVKLVQVPVTVVGPGKQPILRACRVVVGGMRRMILTIANPSISVALLMMTTS